ncbi:MAG: ogr/Delta-like zinc finger family protein [Desulfovibrio sp.]|jgi:transposase-like protein|nr:ogr/Delta-like zinc finger family protein [Desulfovibrio sp.]
MNNKYGIPHSFMKTLCPFCNSENIVRTKTKTGEKVRTRYFRCENCMGNFKTIEVDQATFLEKARKSGIGQGKI